MTTVKLLTPPGTGAIAVLEVRGPDAWRIASQLFQPAKSPLPPTPTLNRRWFGKLAGDEVILAVAGEDHIEVHSHGGRAVVTLIQNQFLNAGCVPAPPSHPNDPWVLLPLAKTLRTTNILLDQCHGAFERAIREILELLDRDPDQAVQRIIELAEYRDIGKHLIEPWTVAIVGAPNAGKSSLVNVLAGYERSLVSPIPGTTRDAVSITLAFDGWPVELIDTAGLRETDEELEAEGIRRSQLARATSDFVIEVIDGTALHLPARSASEGRASPPSLALRAGKTLRMIRLVNKCDSPQFASVPEAIAVSAITGEGLPAMITAIVAAIAPVIPPASKAIPYTPELAKKVNALHKLNLTHNLAEARTILQTCLAGMP